MLPENTITISEFISAGSTVTISYRVLSFLDILSNGTEISILNVINDYMGELRDICMRVKLNDKELRKFAYKPKLLAHELYGNAEVYYLILLLNDIADVKEFDKNKLYLPKPNELDGLLTNILNAEHVEMSVYNSKKNTTSQSTI